MIGRERRGEGEGGAPAAGGTLVTDDASNLLQVPTPVGAFKLTTKKICLVISVAVLVTLLNVTILPTVEANRCFAILVFSTLMWATEVRGLLVFEPIFLLGFLQGNTAICDVSSCSSAACDASRHSLAAGARWQHHSPHQSRSHQVGIKPFVDSFWLIFSQMDILRNVFSDYNAPNRRLHDSLGIEQD